MKVKIKPLNKIKETLVNQNEYWSNGYLAQTFLEEMEKFCDKVVEVDLNKPFGDLSVVQYQLQNYPNYCFVEAWVDVVGC